jgi:putative membrane protein
MQKLAVRWVINAIALWVAIVVVDFFSPGAIEVLGSYWLGILFAAFLFGLVNAVLRPIVNFLTCPLIILTLGLGTLLINTLMFWLTGLLSKSIGFGFTVDGFWPAFFGALILSLVSVPLSMIIKDELGKRRPPKTA